MKIIAGNWKMNLLKAEAVKLVTEIVPVAEASGNTVIVCVPLTCLPEIVSLTRGTKVKVGAQNVHWAENGAFTGEVSAAMLKEAGAEFVLVGHSERRQHFGETDKTVNGRTLAAMKHKLKPIVCIGETLMQRQSGQTEQVLALQLKEGLEWVRKEELKDIIIAYEPVWAIGTGVTATAKQAEEAISFIKKKLVENFGAQLPVLYGGSMNENNAAELLRQGSIDGGLIGGASLSSVKFGKIINAK